jgi:hypothetical protein
VLRIIVLVVMVVLFLMGTFWILQGTGIVPLGFMANRPEYAYLGAGVDIVAIVVFILAWRRHRA